MIKQKIPLSILQLYQDQGWEVQWYARLPWRICSFEKWKQLLLRAGLILGIGCGIGPLVNELVLRSDEWKVMGRDNSVNR